jgi:type IV pilus assembly protein PilQ
LNGRTRVVLNLDRSVPYDVRAQGNMIYVLVGASSGAGASGAASVASTPSASSTRVAQAPNASPARTTAASGGPRSIRNIDFRRGSDGSARIIVELTDSKVPADKKADVLWSPSRRLRFPINGCVAWMSWISRLR